jgi:catechol 2,3-dioxygenase-like lactoylglutathione lyase family enzyme
MGFSGGSMKHDPFREYALTRRDFLAGTAALAAAGAVRAWGAPLPAAAIDHVNIRVPDVDRSAEFYTKLFGGEHVSRSPNAKAQTANPDSPSGVLWFVRTGENSLAISPTGPRLQPAIDHFCFAITGFDGEAMKRDVAGLNHLYPNAPPNNLWVKDSDGYVIQLTRGGDPTRVPGSGVGAVLVPPPGGVPRRPAFRAIRIAQLTLAVPSPGSSAAYYRRLLGDNAEKAQRGTFRVGPSELVLGPVSGGESFRVSVAGFNPEAAVRTLQGLGVSAQATPDRSAVSFRDPDGIHVQISG